VSRTIRDLVCLALALGVLSPTRSVRAQSPASASKAVPIAITSGKIGRYPMSSLLSREWFYLGDKELFIHVPGKTDINQWLTKLKGSLSVLAFPGTDYTPQPSEQGVRGEVIYSLLPANNTHNFFIGDSGIVLVVADVGEDIGQFRQKKQLVDALMPFVGTQVVLIFRRGTT
jgi:hypothetical protein